jgi:hypothetical protein
MQEQEEGYRGIARTTFHSCKVSTAKSSCARTHGARKGEGYRGPAGAAFHFCKVSTAKSPCAGTHAVRKREGYRYARGEGFTLAKCLPQNRRVRERSLRARQIHLLGPRDSAGEVIFALCRASDRRGEDRTTGVACPQRTTLPHCVYREYRKIALCGNARPAQAGRYRGRAAATFHSCKTSTAKSPCAGTHESCVVGLNGWRASPAPRPARGRRRRGRRAWRSRSRCG